MNSANLRPPGALALGVCQDGSDTPSGYTEIDSSYRDRLIIE